MVETGAVGEEEKKQEVTLVTTDGEKTVVDFQVIKICKLIERMMDEVDEDDDAEDIPLKDVKKETLAKIIEFCEHVQTNEPPTIYKPLRSTQLKDLTDEWYANFVDTLGECELFEQVLASNYLECQPLLELTSAKVATLIQHMNVDEVREFFAIENDFSPEEYARVQQEIKWAEECYNN